MLGGNENVANKTKFERTNIINKNFIECRNKIKYGKEKLNTGEGGEGGEGGERNRNNEKINKRK